MSPLQNLFGDLALDSTVASGNAIFSNIASGMATAAGQGVASGLLIGIEQTLSSGVTVFGPITNTELRSQPVEVLASAWPLASGAATDVQLVAIKNAIVSLQSDFASGITVSIGADVEVNNDTGNPIPVTASALPLPNGAATESTLIAASGTLNSIDSRLSSGVISVSGPITNTELRATDVQVTASGWPLPQGAATLVAQSSGTVKLEEIRSALGTLHSDLQVLASGIKITNEIEIANASGSAISVSGPLTDAQLRATPVIVSGSALVNVGLTNAELRASVIAVGMASAAPLASGASTLGNQLSANQSLSNIDQRLGSAIINVSLNADVLTETVMQSSAVGVGSGASLNVRGFSTTIINVTGIFVGTITLEASSDGLNFHPILAAKIGAGIIASTITTTGLFRISCGAINTIRARISNYVSGSITISGRSIVSTTGEKTITLADGVNAIGATTGLARTTALPAAVENDELVKRLQDKFGRQVVIAGTIRDLVGVQTTTISASIAETTIITAGASGVLNDLVMLIISNTSASTDSRIDFRDSVAGTVRFSLMSRGGGQPVGFVLPVPIPQTAAAAVWTATCAIATTDVRVYAVFQRNQ